MLDVVGIGACVADTLMTVPDYPDEDTKMRAEKTKISGGGPAAGALVAVSKLGESAGYIGVLSNDGMGKFLKEDFKKYGVSTEYVKTLDGYASFTSVIWLSKKTASRTCVFDKGTLPPLVLDEEQKRAVADAKVLMIDGNELEAAYEACKIARANGTKVLYDCGGLYEGIDKLLELTDIMIPSEEFALKKTGKDDAVSAAKKLYETYSPEIVVITRGKKGGIMFDGNEIKEYNAFKVNAVDSNGSGDMFHGAFAAGIIKGFEYFDCCVFSSAVSAIKCTGFGARESVPDYAAAKNFLKENGYEL